MHMRQLKSGFLLVASGGWLAAGLGIALANGVVWQLGVLVAIAAVALALAVPESASRVIPPSRMRASHAASVGLAMDEHPIDAPSFAPVPEARAADARKRLSKLPDAPSADNPIELRPRRGGMSARSEPVETFEEFPFSVSNSGPAPIPVTVANGPGAMNGRAREHGNNLDLNRLPLAGAILDPGTSFTKAGPADGVTRGVCSKCDTPIELSSRRPIRATCPVCGHSKLLN